MNQQAYLAEEVAEHALPAVRAPGGYAREARRMIGEQSCAVAALAERVDGRFDRAIELLLGLKGRVVTAGVGQCGLIARKLAATLSSTGTPAFFLHPAEALHGDLGMVQGEDLVVAVSETGETREIVTLLGHLIERGVPALGIVGRSGASVSRLVALELDAAGSQHQGGGGPASMRHSVALLALCDALAVTLMRARGFGASDFARLHPGGLLGRRLTARVRDSMRSRDLPLLAPCTTVGESLLVITRAKLGLGVVVRADRDVLGIVTDGDLRRGLQRHSDLLERPISEIMSPHPVCIHPDDLLVEAERRMQLLGIRALLVTDDEARLVGTLQIYDE